MNQKIIDYLQQNKGQYAKEDLVEALKKAGHKDEDIQEAVRIVYLPPTPTPAPANPEPPTLEQQSSISKLKSMQTEDIQFSNNIPLPQQKKASFQNNVEYVDFWVRFAAFIIDLVVIHIMSIPFNLLMYHSGESAMLKLVGISMLFSFTITGLYSIIMLNKYQATIGKMVVGIIVCNENSLDKPSSGTIIKRTIIKIFTGRLTMGLIYFIALTSPKVQALHDKIAHTVVIYKNKK